MNLFTKKFLVLFIIASSIAIMTSWVEDPPNYHSGAPGELTCGNCHMAPASNPSTGILDISGLPDTIVPSTDYTITVRMTKSSGPATQAGFQMTLINEGIVKIGTFSNPSAGAAISNQLFRDYFEHRPAAIFPANNIVEWTVTWRSPDEEDAFSQPVKIYATGLLGDGDSTVLNDVSLAINKTYYFKSNYTQIAANLTPHPVTCSGGEDGSITVNVSGGREPYKYLWNTGDTTKNVDSLHAGTYAVTITDDGIDTFIHHATITQPFPVFGEIIKTDIPCNSSVSAEAIVVPSQGVAPYTYLWSSGSTTNTASYDTPGQILVTITDFNGCSYVATSSIIKKGDFTASINDVANTKCYGTATGSATVIASIPFPTSYVWSNGATTAHITDLAAGDYSVTVSNVDGCEARATVTILEPTPIRVTPTTLKQPSCEGSFNGLISISADGGVPPYEYEWEDGTTIKTISTLVAGDYQVTVTDAFGCKHDDTITLSEPAPINTIIDFLNESGPGANNGKANIIASGGTAPYTFAWSDGGSGKDRSDLKPGYYTITVTDVKGCTTVSNLYIYPFDCSLVVNDALVEHVDCNGESSGNISLDVSGGTAPYTYKWSDGQDTGTASGLKAGVYTVTVTDEAGCETHGYFKLNQPPPFVKILNIKDVTNPDFVDGEVKFVFSGGAPPYTLIFDVGDTITTYTGIITFDNLFQGLHSYSVTDANGCNFAEFFVINIAGCLLQPGNIVIQDVKCAGGTDGAICISVQNATGNYSVFWDDESTDLCRLNLSAGKYNVHIEDDAGCQSLDTLTIKQPTAIKMVNTNLVKPDFGESNGAISVVLAGGIPPYTFTWWKDGVPLVSTESNLINIAAGNYVYVATDGNGCNFESDTIKLENLPLGTDRNRIQPLSIAPNPTSGFVTLKWDGILEGEITIINSLGQIIKSEKVKNLNSIELDLNTVQPGVYGVIMRTKGKSYSGRIVVNR